MRSPFKPAFALFALSVALPALIAGEARAEPPVTAAGVFVVVPSGAPTVQPAGDGVSFIELAATFSLSGTLEGEFAADFFIIQFAPYAPVGPQRFLAEGTYEGDVAGATGSFDFVFAGEIDEDGNAEGDLVIGRGTRELKNLSGRITLAGLAGVGGLYEGQIHFAP